MAVQYNVRALGLRDLKSCLVSVKTLAHEPLPQHRSGVVRQAGGNEVNFSGNQKRKTFQVLPS